MKASSRGPAPELLERFGPEITQDYVSKRQSKPNHEFKWPKSEGRSLKAVTLAALVEMTQNHCSYCDGYPLGSMSRKEIDHFKPKSLPEFYNLVCAWENLFVTCNFCNNAKRTQWEPALLRPDEDDFAFDRYFLYDAYHGTLEPSPAASADHQQRACRTIEILDLNRDGLCEARKAAAKNYLRIPTEELADWGFRFLIPICRDEPTSPV